MSCSSCTRSINDGLHQLPGVQECQVSLLTETAEVYFDPTLVHEDLIMRRLRSMGYTTSLVRVDRRVEGGCADEYSLSITGMVGVSSGHEIEQVVRGMEGVLRCVVYVVSSTAKVSLKSSERLAQGEAVAVVGIRDVVDKLASLGYYASVVAECDEVECMEQAQAGDARRLR